MQNDLASRLVREYETKRDQRGAFTSHYQQAARYVWPDADEFWETKGSSAKGEYKHNHIYDDTACRLLPRFAAVLESMLVPRGEQWHGLKTGVTKLDETPSVRKWLQDCTDILFAKRYSPKANFQAQIGSVFQSLALGNGTLHVDYKQGEGFKYRAPFIGDVFFAENECGIVDRVYRRLDLEHHQAAAKFNQDDDKLPDQVTKKLDKQPFESDEYLHVSVPNPDYVFGSEKPAELKYRDVYIHLGTKTIVRDGGTAERPYAVSRYSKAPHEENGRGPALQVLPTIKRLNEISRDMFRAANKQVDPPMLVADDGFWGGSMRPNLAPGSYNPGALTADGRALIQPLQTGIRLDFGEFVADKAVASVQDAFLLSLYQIINEVKAGTSATEAMIRAQEKADLLAPIIARQKTELLGPIIERELSLAVEHGLLPDMPRELTDYLETSGLELDVVYSSPLDALQLSSRLAGIAQVTQLTREMSTFDPNVYRYLDPPVALSVAAKASNAPADFVRSREDVQRDMQAEAESNQQMMDAEAAPMLADASKKFAEAQAIQRGGVQ